MRTTLGQVTPAFIEKMIGDLVAPNVTAVHGGIDPDTGLQAYVKGVGAKLLRYAARPDVDYQVDVLASTDIPNAYALGNGHMFITRALLQMLDNEAQLAAILGHELGHVDKRHIAKQLDVTVGGMAAAGLAEKLIERLAPRFGKDPEKLKTTFMEKLPEFLPKIEQYLPKANELLAKIGLGLTPIPETGLLIKPGIPGIDYPIIRPPAAKEPPVSIDPEEPPPPPAPPPPETPPADPQVMEARDVMVGLLVNGYSRQHELEADRKGLQSSALAGYNPYAIVDVMKKFQTLEGEPETGIAKYMRSHPLAKDRIAELEERIAKDYPTPGGFLGYEEYQNAVYPERISSQFSYAMLGFGAAVAGVVSIFLLPLLLDRPKNKK